MLDNLDDNVLDIGSEIRSMQLFAIMSDKKDLHKYPVGTLYLDRISGEFYEITDHGDTSSDVIIVYVRSIAKPG